MGWLSRGSWNRDISLQRYALRCAIVSDDERKPALVAVVLPYAKAAGCRLCKGHVELSALDVRFQHVGF